MQKLEKMAYSIQEAAEALGLAASTIRVMIESGQLHAVRIGHGKGKFLIPRRALDDLLSRKVA